ncbi:MAG: threonine ammonia-lyase [Magnetovibrionaceae bacterium]
MLSSIKPAEGALTREDVEAAAARIDGQLRRTPLLENPLLNERLGFRLLAKAECLQVTGSFKARGAFNAIASLEPDVRARGVVAFSSGNHGQGIAWAARHFGIPAWVVMPADAPQPKLAATAAWGAEVITYDRATEDRSEIGARLCAERGAALIPPFDHPGVIAGQGTTGLEILEQANALDGVVDRIIVCTSGGGLAAGIGLAFDGQAPVKDGLWVAEPQGFDDYGRSLVSGKRELNAARSGSLCDALLVSPCGELTFPLTQSRYAGGLSVSDDEALAAMKLAYGAFRVVVEPGGAVALAAACKNRKAGSTTVVTLSGGNVSDDVFAQALKIQDPERQLGF